MAEKGKGDTMRRKAGAGRPAPEIGRVTAPRSLQAAVAQGAEEILALVATATHVGETRTNLNSFLENTPQDALYCLCQAREIHFGIAVFDITSLSAVIEQQTTGRVVPKPAAARTPTRTDARLCAGFLDRIMEIFERNVADADLPVAPAICGYRYALPLADRRAVEMTLPDMPYRLFDLQIDFAEGAKTGQMQILLPYEVTGGAREGESDLWQADLSEVVQCTQVEMEAILARKQMALADVSALEVGSLLKLPIEVIRQVRLEDLNGVVVTLGQLGQTGGKRALRIADTCDAMPEDLAGFDASTHTVPEVQGQMAEPGAILMGSDSDPDGLPDTPPADDFDIGEMPADLPDLGALGGDGGPGSSLDASDLADLGAAPDISIGGDEPDLPDLSDLPDLENV